MDKQERKELICEIKKSDIPEPSKEKLIELLENLQVAPVQQNFKREKEGRKT